MEVENKYFFNFALTPNNICMDVTFIVEITSDCYLYLATYRVFNNLMTHGCTDWWTLPLIPNAI